MNGQKKYPPESDYGRDQWALQDDWENQEELNLKWLFLDEGRQYERAQYELNQTIIEEIYILQAVAILFEMAEEEAEEAEAKEDALRCIKKLFTL
jgi:hypothetical protein